LQLSVWINPQIFSDEPERFSEKFDFHSTLWQLIGDFCWLPLVLLLGIAKRLHNLSWCKEFLMLSVSPDWMFITEFTKAIRWSISWTTKVHSTSCSVWLREKQRVMGKSRLVV
jgi:hypothetical protein